MPHALLSSRAVLEITGTDARAFLQGLITQSVEGMAEGDWRFSALLTPQGKILFDFMIAARGAGFLIDAHQGAAEALAKKLALHRLRAKVEIGRRDDLAVAASWGADGEVHAAAVDPRLAALGRRRIGPVSEIAVADPESAYAAHRIALAVPQSGDDFGPEEVFLTDVNYDALAGVDYRKGCFVGQEVTSRMKRKGEIRRRAMAVSGQRALARGEPIGAGDSALGDVIAASAQRAIALIRIDRARAAAAAGTPFHVGAGTDVAPVAIIAPAYLPEAGLSAPLPGQGEES